MKNKFIVCLVLVLFVSFLSGCNFMTKNFGGTTEITLEPNRKLIECTWKDDSLWYLTREMKEDDIAEDYRFDCDSNFGVFEGTVIIHEVKDE